MFLRVVTCLTLLFFLGTWALAQQGVGISAGTTVESITDDTHFVLSLNATGGTHTARTISFGNATEIAKNSSEVVIIGGNNLSKVIKAIENSHLTLKTIKQNLFWALAYNVIAIPIAAIGLLSPIIAAGSMAFSDLVVIGNSVRLKFK